MQSAGNITSNPGRKISSPIWCDDHYLEPLLEKLEGIKVGEITLLDRGVPKKWKDNGAEGLKLLQARVHDTKESRSPDQAAEMFIAQEGLDVIIECMIRNPRDTVVANRALEIMVGAARSNSSLPLLNHPVARSSMLRLGLHNVCLQALQLPDLQLISRGLCCQALQALAVDVYEDIVANNGVTLLTQQVFRVNGPEAFGALAALARRSEAAVESIKAKESIEEIFMERFAEAPHTYSPEQNPSAVAFFVSVWTWDEIEKAVDSLGDHANLELVKNSLKIGEVTEYPQWKFIKDTVMAVVHVVLGVISCALWQIQGSTDFFLITICSLIFTTAMTTRALTSRNVAPWEVAANVGTLGGYAMMSESFVCHDRGFRTERLVGLKMIEAVGSAVSFCLNTYRFLISGLAFQGLMGLIHHDVLTGWPLVIRWLTTTQSLVFLTMTCYDVVIARTLPGKREFGPQYTDRAPDTDFKIKLFFYQLSENTSWVVYLFFQLMVRPQIFGQELPFSIFLLIGFEALIIVGAIYIVRPDGKDTTVPIVPLVLGLAFNILGGPNADVQFVSRMCAGMRLASLFIVWIVVISILMNWSGEHGHLWEPNRVVLGSIGFIGFFVHVLCAVEQYFAGRWLFDTLGMGLDERLLRKTEVKVGHYTVEVCSKAPKYVKTKWADVHNFLPSPTARVPLDAFLQVNSDICRTPDGHHFVKLIFEAATGLMLPKVKADLGKHCFGYAMLMCEEYAAYQCEKTVADTLGLLNRPHVAWFDPLKEIRTQVEDDWSAVAKNDEGNAGLAAFTQSMLARHDAKLGGIQSAKMDFTKFLERSFRAFACFHGGHVPCLNRLSFCYNAFFCYEFYFSDARDPVTSEGCGCSTPVADNLDITAN